MQTSENIISGSQVHEPAMQWQADLMEHLREWDGKYGPTYLVPWQPWHVTPMTGDLGWTSWTCRFLWLPYKRCVYCRLDQWCLILVPFSVLNGLREKCGSLLVKVQSNPLVPQAASSHWIRSKKMPVLWQCIRSSYIFVSGWGPGFVAEGQGQLQSWKDDIHKWQIALMRSCSVLFFLDCNGSQWIPVQSQDVSNCGHVSFPYYRSSTPATPRERASWSCARKSMCRRPGRQVLPFSTSVLSFKHGERKENQKHGKV